jgi:hypothetical protein
MTLSPLLRSPGLAVKLAFQISNGCLCGAYGAAWTCRHALSENGAASVLHGRAQIGKIEAHKVRLIRDK